MSCKCIFHIFILHLIDLPSSKSAVRRGITSSGLMVKGGGSQSVYGASYHAQTSIDKITSANPKPATIEKVRAQTQLRYELKIAEPGILSLFSEIIRC